MKGLVLALIVLLAACHEVAPEQQTRVRPARGVSVSTLQAVANRVIPAAEAVCRQRTSNVNCKYALVLDPDPRAQPNAYQTRRKSGQPQITITKTLLASLENADEVAFVLSHEAAHHIRGHLDRANTDATIGAVAGGVLASVLGTNVDAAQQIGAAVGGRAYSKNYELEADRLGAIIAMRAGYDPVVGVRYFTRSPDPGNAFLGTHPPNADRIRAVRVVAGRY